MALLNSWSSANRVVLNDKVVTYSQQRIYGEWSYINGVSQIITLHSAWEYHRYCSKTYMYVGMDISTANLCAQAMITKYTRNYSVSQWNSSGDYKGQFTDISGGTVCMADICVQQREGHMYDVIINVREDDSRQKTYSTSPQSLFTAENARDYDNA